MINKEAYNFKKENENVFRLQARNLVTNELVDTDVLLFTEDVSLAAKVDLATQAIGEIARAEEKPDIATSPYSKVQLFIFTSKQQVATIQL